MSSYIAIIAIFMITFMPVLIPTGVSVVHAITTWIEKRRSTDRGNGLPHRPLRERV